MNEAPFSRRAFFAAILLSSLILIIIFFSDFLNKKTKIVFCDVGQGDGAYIRTSDKVDIVIDAGRDRSILNCLGKYMPFYDRTIELAFLSHPQFDHYQGYNYIIDRYRIQTFIANSVNNDNQSYNLLKAKLKEKGVQIKNMYSGDNLTTGAFKINFLWPSANFVAQNTVLGATTLDLNDFSEMFVFSEGEFDVLFTGDINTGNLQGFMNAGPVEVFKVPHHGSKNGLTEDFLKKINPELSVISVGKNSYGHPSPEILEMLTRLKKKYLRTDKEGDIVVEVDPDSIGVDDTNWRVIN